MENEKIFNEIFDSISNKQNQNSSDLKIMCCEMMQEVANRIHFHKEKSEKTLINTTASQAKDNVKDIMFYGDGDTFKLISKASSVKEKWMKSTKAMQIDGVGCVIQATTQQGDNVAEALTFVPNVKISEVIQKDGKVTSRKLVVFDLNDFRKK